MQKHTRYSRYFLRAKHVGAKEVMLVNVTLGEPHDIVVQLQDA